MLGREAMLAELLAALEPHLTKGVGYLIDDAPGTIGAKRQRMIEAATADYIARILPCLRSKPDCVGITMHVTMVGRDWRPSPIFRHSLQFKENFLWHGQDRTPHHLCPLRRAVALQSRFPDIMWGEDYNYAQGLLQHLKTEEWSGDEPIYFYNYVSKKTDPPIPSQQL